MALTEYKCSCGEKLTFETQDESYACKSCGKKYGKDQVLKLKGRKNKKLRKGVKNMATKGACVVCGRGGVTIVGHDMCGACYRLGKEFNFDVDKTKAAREEHPVHKKGMPYAKGGKKTGKKMKWMKDKMKATPESGEKEYMAVTDDGTDMLNSQEVIEEMASAKKGKYSLAIYKIVKELIIEI